MDVALEAAALIAAEIPGVRLSVIGGASGPTGTVEVERLAERPGQADLAGVVDFHAAVPHGELAEYYRAADVVMIPSRSEAFGLVAAEAQSCGVPVVAARVGGLEHVVADDLSGILVDGWDPEDHAAAVVSVLSDPELSARLSAGALRWSERFSWDSTANRFLELYEGAVHRAGRG